LALSKDSKKEILQDLITKLKESKGVVLTDYQGMNVFQISRLRNELKEKRVEFKIVKNTLMEKASENSQKYFNGKSQRRIERGGSDQRSNRLYRNGFL
jgi:ribosomal protein L10